MTLGLRVDGSEGEVDAWTPVMVLFSHLVLLNGETGADIFVDLTSNLCSRPYGKMEVYSETSS